MKKMSHGSCGPDVIFNQLRGYLLSLFFLFLVLCLGSGRGVIKIVYIIWHHHCLRQASLDLDFVTNKRVKIRSQSGRVFSWHWMDGGSPCCSLKEVLKFKRSSIFLSKLQTDMCQLSDTVSPAASFHLWERSVIRFLCHFSSSRCPDRPEGVTKAAIIA